MGKGRDFRMKMLSSTGPRRGEVWFAESLPFDGITGAKSRPVVIKKRENNMFVCFKCTSQRSNIRNRYKVLNPIEAGLDKDSYIDYDPIVVPKEKLTFCLGELTVEDLSCFGKL